MPSDDRYVWIADVYHSLSEHPIGSATIVQNKYGEINGNIDVEGVFFQIHPLCVSDMHAFVEFDREEMKHQKNARAEIGNPNQSAGGAVTMNKNLKLPGSALN